MVNFKAAPYKHFTVQVHHYEYYSARANNSGWCTHCKEFTTENIYPDDRKEHCFECGNNNVYGAECALILGYFEVVRY